MTKQIVCWDSLGTGPKVPVKGFLGLIAALALGCSSPGAEPGLGGTSDAGGRPDASDAGDATGTSSTGMGSTSGANTSGGFVNEPSDQRPSWVQCDIWNRGDCDEGSKCMPVALEVGAGFWDSNVCRPILGDARAGDPCHSFDLLNGLDDCAEGSFCWDPDPDSKIGMCVEACGGSPNSPSCPGEQFCNMDKNGIMPMCMEPCPPLEDDCPVGCSCQPVSIESTFSCLPVWDDALGVGEHCEWQSACAAGTVCANAGEAACDADALGQCCAAYCDVNAEQPCADPGLSCEPYFGEGAPPDAGGTYIGVCVSPDQP